MRKKIDYDGVVTAVKYTPEGTIDWVRAFERHGFVFSDRINLDRETLISRIEDGKRFKTGTRKIYLANEFEIKDDIQLAETNGQTIILAGGESSQNDSLGDLPTL
jgi:hypothetical protein